MLLSSDDIRLLKEAGFSAAEFVRYDRKGAATLRNRESCCVFYDSEKRRCRVYRVRPSGCRVYPVLYNEGEKRAVVDELCPLWETVSERELSLKGMKVVKLLRRIDSEAKLRLRHV